jgi:hypothetical protein
MKNILFLCALFSAAALFHGQAQTAPQATPPPLAPGPLISRAPDFSQWMMSMKSGALDPTQLASPQNIKFDQRTLVTKTGPIRREISATADGQKTEMWLWDKYQATTATGHDDPTIVMQGANARAGFFADYSKSDFTGFDWISKNNYIGVQAMEGIPCIVFHEGPAELPSGAPANGAPAIPESGSTAYISLQGRLPVLLQTDSAVVLYQWQQAPTTQLTLPANVKAAVDRIQARLTQAAAPPAIP